MRTRLIALLVAAAVALLGTSLAVAAKRAGKGTDRVTTSFTAAATAKSKTRTCSGVDGKYRFIDGRYEGTASGDARLTGRLLIRLRTVVNATTGDGYTTGQLVIRASDGKLKAKASLAAATSDGSIVDGLLRGRVKAAGADAPAGMLIANFRASLSGDGTQLSGELGGGAAQNSAIVFSGAGCERPARAQRRSARGTITAITDASVTVRPESGDALTCTTTARQRERVRRARAAVGARAALVCTASLELISLKLLR